MRSFYTDSVTRVRPQTGTDAHNPVASIDWSLTAVESTLTGCRFQPVSTVEDLRLRDGVEVNARLMGPVDMDLTAQDRVEYGGLVYEVVGEPLAHRGPYGTTAHVEVLLRRFDG